MSEISSEKPEKQMPVTTEQAHRIMREAINDCAFPVRPGEKMKTWLVRVARSVGLTSNRLYDIYCGETVPRWHEGEAIRLRAAEQKARWGDMARRQSIAELNSDIKRTRDHGDQVEARQMAGRVLGVAREKAEPQGRFVFWLGGQDADLD